MGFLDDIRSDIGEAKAARDTVTVEPALRIDTLVQDIGGEARHRTDYAGTAWFGGRPRPGRTLVGGTAQIATAFWLPDSQGYDPASAEDVRLQATCAIQAVLVGSTGGGLLIYDATAALASAGDLLRVAVTVTAQAGLPLGVSYRVTTLAPPSAVRP